MLEGAQRAALRFLKVPPEPDPPAGAPGSVRVFRAAPNFLRYNVFRWGLKQLSTLFGILVGLYFVAQGWFQEIQFGPWSGEDWFWVLEAIGIGSFVLQIPFTLAGVILDFRMRWYIVTDRSLRIREGIAQVREKTISFANIQNLGVRQGPVQRLLGLYDLEVKTAGGGGAAGNEGEEEHDDLHTGYFRGVDNAEEIKAIILQRLRRLRDSGLGDPEESGSDEVPLLEVAPLEASRAEAPPLEVPQAEAPSLEVPGAEAPAPAGPSPLLAAAAEVLEEARRLRAAAGGR